MFPMKGSSLGYANPPQYQQYPYFPPQYNPPNYFQQPHVTRSSSYPVNDPVQNAQPVSDRDTESNDDVAFDGGPTTISSKPTLKTTPSKKTLDDAASDGAITTATTSSKAILKTTPSKKTLDDGIFMKKRVNPSVASDGATSNKTTPSKVSPIILKKKVNPSAASVEAPTTSTGPSEADTTSSSTGNRITASRSKDGQLEPFNFREDSVTIECWVVSGNNIVNNINSDREKCILERVLRHSSKNQKNAFVSDVYIYKTLSSESYHLGIMSRNTRSPFVFIPTRESLETVMRILLCSSDYKDAECTKHLSNVTIGDVTLDDQKKYKPLKQVIEQIPNICNDEFLEEHSDKVTKGKLVFDKSLKWEFDGELPKFKTPQKNKKQPEYSDISDDSSDEDEKIKKRPSRKPKRVVESSDEEQDKTTQRQRASTDDELDFESSHDPEEGEGGDSKNSEEADNDTNNEPESDATMDDGEKEPNSLKRKRNDKAKESSQPKAKKTSKQVAKTTNGTVSEILSNFLSNEEVKKSANRINLETILTDVTLDRFIANLSDANEALFDNEIFKNEILLKQLLPQYRQEKKEDYIDNIMEFCGSDLRAVVESEIKTFKYLNEEQKDNHLRQYLDNDRCFDFAKINEEWMKTELFKQNILPNLLFDYMRSNRDEYIDHVISLEWCNN